MVLRECYVHDYSILQHAVVCRVTTAGIRAKALTLGWKPINWVDLVGSMLATVKSSIEI